MFLILPLILLPLICGAVLPLLKSKKVKDLVVLCELAVESVLSVGTLFLNESKMLLFSMTDKLSVSLQIDGMAKIFMIIASIGFLFAGIYASGGRYAGNGRQ